MEKIIKFEVGKTYYSKIDEDNFTVKGIDVEESEIVVEFENGTHGYCNRKGIVPFWLSPNEARLNVGLITSVEPEKTKNNGK